MTALTNTKEFSKFSTEVNKNELKWFKHDPVMIEQKSKLEGKLIINYSLYYFTYYK
jgi:hypothetical protein